MLDNTSLEQKKFFSYVKILGWIAVVAIAFFLYSETSSREELKIQNEFIDHGLKQCGKNLQSPIVLENRTKNPRYQLFNKESDALSETLIKNALIIDGDGHFNHTKHDIYIVKGLIVDIKKCGEFSSLETSSKVEVIDAKGHYVSPGLVEMHSHVGICSQPELKGVNDMFELMSPATPFTRVIDAFNIGDPAIQMSAGGGVTSALILPSANLISGEGYVFKFAVPPSHSVEDMLVQYSPIFEDLERHRWMKMACGENPKKRYVSRPEAPKSRMGLGHLFRETMQRAQRLKDQQDLWCESVLHTPPTSRYPMDDNLDLLVDLLRGKVNTNVHCYETFDIETILRHAREFGIEINALHHSLDAFMIPEIIKRQGYEIVMATFASVWGFKKEAFQASLFGPKILQENNLTVILTTDHPALPGHSLINQAQMAHNYGLSADKAFASVTGEPAKALRLSDRIGFLRIGYDADLVIWNEHPLQMGAKPLKVFIDGHKVVDLPLEEGATFKSVPLSIPEVNEKQVEMRILEGLETYLITGIIGSLVREESSILNPIIRESVETPSTNTPYELYVQNNQIQCFASNCSQYYTQNIATLELENGVVFPMLTVLTAGHGLIEMESETMTGDGILVKALEENTLPDFKNPDNVIKAVNGLQFGGIHLQKAFHSGVGNIITPPFRGEGKLFVTGVSVGFLSNGDDFSSVIKEETALHITLGDDGKQAGVPTISSQISALQKLLSDNSKLNNVYGKVARKELKLAIHTSSKDNILRVIRLKQSLDIDVIIIGGIESHLIAAKLAENDIPVVVTIWQCQRRFWDERRCLSGLYGQSTLLRVLHDAGVKVGMGVEDDSKVRVLLPDSAAAAALSGLSSADMMQMMSTNMQEIFGLESVTNTFVISEGDPLQYGSRIGAIIQNGKLIKVFPEIEPHVNSLIE